MTLSHLAKLIYASDLFDASVAYNTIVSENVSVFVGLPEHFEELIKI